MLIGWVGWSNIVYTFFITVRLVMACEVNSALSGVANAGSRLAGVSGRGRNLPSYIVLIEFDYFSVHVVESSDLIVLDPLSDALPDPRLDHVGGCI